MKDKFDISSCTPKENILTNYYFYKVVTDEPPTFLDSIIQTHSVFGKDVITSFNYDLSNQFTNNDDEKWSGKG